ncbi:hypothetical protein BV20DRAFT_993708 [Pilatotrama ljubarskyi]|nr:hypothetical protein BV20DRAFT_993708 [Pilatotrama ljubarskyi]
MALAQHENQRRQVNLPGSRLTGFDPSTSTSSTDSPSLPGGPILSTGGPTATVTSTSTVVVSPPSQPTTMSLPGSRLSLTDPGTPTSTGASTNPTPSLSFGTVPLTNTCSSVTIPWTYSGPDEDISLLVYTDIGPHPDGTSGAGNVTIMGAPVAVNIDAASQSFTWSPVNLTLGWYRVRAVGPGIAAESSQFCVLTGTDNSCLSSSSTSSSTPTPTSAPSVIATSNSASPTSSSTILPVTDAVSSHSRAGAIAGGVIGGVAIIAAAVAAYIYFGLCRRTPTRSRRRELDGSGRPGHLGKWGGLSSRDSGMDVGLPVSTAPTSGRTPVVLGLPKKRGTTESTGPILSPLSSTAYGHSTTSRGVSDDDISSLAHEEKAPPSRGHELFESVPPVAGDRRRSSLSSPGVTPPITPTAAPHSAQGFLGRARAKSSSQSHRALALAKLDGEPGSSPPSSVPPTPRTRSPTVPRRSVDSMQLRTFDAPPMPMQVNPGGYVEASTMGRTSSGNGPRRATRKPVPTLDESDMMPPPSATAPSFSSASVTSTAVSRGPSVASSSGGSRSPGPSPQPMYRNKSDSGSGSTLRAGGASPVPGRQHSREDLIAAGMELPNLNHKSSFGDKQVHYIIPDMPPPPRE